MSEGRVLKNSAGTVAPPPCEQLPAGGGARRSEVGGLRGASKRRAVRSEIHVPGLRLDSVALAGTGT